MTSFGSLHTLDEHTKTLGQFLPNGCLYDAKRFPDSTMYKLNKGFAGELQRMEEFLFEIAREYDPRTTTNFILNWERMVGIPDDCFSGTEDIETRRKHIVVKLLSFGAATEQDFIDLAAFLGFTITIEHLPDVNFFPPYDVPISLITGVPESRFVMVVVGEGVVPNVPPYDVPFTPGGGIASVLQCFFDKLKPANTKIIYRNA